RAPCGGGLQGWSTGPCPPTRRVAWWTCRSMVLLGDVGAQGAEGAGQVFVASAQVAHAVDVGGALGRQCGEDKGGRGSDVVAVHRSAAQPRRPGDCEFLPSVGHVGAYTTGTASPLPSTVSPLWPKSAKSCRILCPQNPRPPRRKHDADRDHRSLEPLGRQRPPRAPGPRRGPRTTQERRPGRGLVPR